MQIQCPKCNGWTDTETNTCNLCGANLGLISTQTPGNEYAPDGNTNASESNDLSHDQPIDVLESIHNNNFMALRAAMQDPDQKVIVNGKEMTAAEWKNLVEEHGRKERQGCLKLLGIVVAILLIPLFLYLIGSC